jgi:beta-xylosidase
VGNDYYMTASSFNASPGLPILHSRDLVNWSLVNYALPRQIPVDHFSSVQHGNGVWAPAIRFHKGRFYIYYPDPDFGIYMISATDPKGKWTDPVLVEAGKGLIDPCPLWDDNGKVYLVHAFAGSRAGIKSVLVIKQMNNTGTAVTNAGVMVYDGHEIDPTIEGPKLYKRNGYYYIFAPAGGVATGWQVVLRSKNIYGPYERKVVMDQGNSPINGPHQGAWVNTSAGEDWFFHFQDKEAFGRVVHLQPMEWKNDWPVIGADPDGDGKGEPVLTHVKPRIAASIPMQTPPDSDEFNGTSMGLQWQWQANPSAAWSFLDPSKGILRLFSAKAGSDNLWQVPNLLLQKLPAPTFTVTTKLRFTPQPRIEQERAGIVMMGLDYAALSLERINEQIQLSYAEAINAEKGGAEKKIVLASFSQQWVYLRMQMKASGICQFSYSLDGSTFKEAGKGFTPKPGKWVGARMGLFCTRTTQINDAGFLDIDWWRVE